MFNVLGSIAEFERDLIRERVSAGMQAAKRRGQRFGRPAALSAEARARVRLLHEAGHSLRTIARAVGVSHATVAREVARLRVKQAA